MSWETFTKAVVIISILIAQITQIVLAARNLLFLPWLSGLAFVGTLLGARYLGKPALALVLSLLYIGPSLSFLLSGEDSALLSMTTSGLFGLILANPNLRTWDLPREWKFPLVLWAFIVALSWPVVLLRELDFAPLLTFAPTLFSNANGVPITVAATGVVYVTLIQGIGFLWIDWLFRTFGANQRIQFERWVLIPLGVSLLLSTLVALYQASIDIHFLSRPPWNITGRAPGTLLDANPMGVLAACWGPAFLVLASQRRGLGVIAALALIASWLGVLASGSRSGLIIVVITLPYLLWLGWKWGREVWQPHRLIWSLGALGLMGGLIGAVLWLPMTTPLHRLHQQLSQKPLQPGLVALIKTQLQDRPLFAGIATRMVEEFPLTGVGLGSFNILLNDYARKYHLGDGLPFDNALNWYIHQAAELGLVGSIGWVLWIIVFIRTLLRPPATAEAALPAGILKCLLVAFGVASLVGVHAHNPQVLLTFWVFTFWLSTYVNQPASIVIAEETAKQTSSHKDNSYDRLLPRSPSLAGKLWVTIIGISGMYIAILAHGGMEVLRVPYRATLADWNYTYGFYNWEQVPDVGRFRWTQRKAVTVIPVAGPWLCSTLWAHHPDLSTNPVRIQMWIDQQLATDLWLRDRRSLRRCFSLPDNKARIAVTLRVNRTWRPRDYNQKDPRNLGVAVTPWTFAQSPQEGQATP